MNTPPEANVPDEGYAAAYMMLESDMARLKRWMAPVKDFLDWPNAGEVVKAARYWKMIQDVVVDNPTAQAEWERFLMFARISVDEEVPGLTITDHRDAKIKDMKLEIQGLLDQLDAQKQLMDQKDTVIAQLQHELGLKDTSAELRLDGPI